VIKRLLAAAAIATLSLSSAACTKEGDCEKTVDHIMKLIERDLPAGQRGGDPAKERAELIEQCKSDDNALTKRQEECVLKAQNLPELNRCDRR
jgi:hypothetical protein